MFLRGSPIPKPARVAPLEKLQRKVPAGKTPTVLVAVGSYSPITTMHLRMFEDARDELQKVYFSSINDAS